MRKSEGSEQRQHLMLSVQAYNTLVEDSLNYYGRVNLSGCINRIIRNSNESSSASVSNYAMQRREHYLNILNTGKLGLPLEKISDVVRTLVDNEVLNLQKELYSYPKDVPLKIRLQDDIWEELYGEEEWLSRSGYSSQGAYIKATLEDYAHKAPYEREGIFFRETIEQLNNAILLPKGEKRVLKIKYITAAGNRITCNIKPYRILPDTAKQYHYLVALSCPLTSMDYEYNIASFRISRIQDAITSHAKSYGSGSISHKESKQIESLLNKNGVQFLLNNNDEIIEVLMTPKGVNSYNTQYYMRPSPMTVIKTEELENGYMLYEFNCTRSQIEYYFFKFGEDAIILSPPDLANSFKTRYETAANQYSTTGKWFIS